MGGCMRASERTRVAEVLASAGRTWLALAVFLTVGCGHSSPTGPTPPPANGLLLTCPSPVGSSATTAEGIEVSYTRPIPVGGQAPVTLACSPESGQRFPLGVTHVTCTATDAVRASASCSFDVTVTPNLRTTRTRYLAFGDSITAGEVTVPIGSTKIFGRVQDIFAQVVVPSASYPSVLLDRLSQRYNSQTITVDNQGKPGDQAATAFPRFQAAVLASQPEVVLLLMGYNDIGSSASSNAAANAMGQMVNFAAERGAHVILATLTPSIPGRQRSEPESAVVYYNTQMRALAAKAGIPLVDLYEAAAPDLSAWIGVDGLHPTEAGYAKMAEEFFKMLQAQFEVR